jgi:hypothetical protein
MGTVSEPRRTWLVLAAEAREFAGILRRVKAAKSIDGPRLDFAREIQWREDRWLLVANGPGPRLAEAALDARPWNVDGLMSVGFCGALDPMLHVGDIVVSGEAPKGTRPLFFRGEVLSQDRVAVTSEEKRRLRAASGAAVVEMESAAVAFRARQWGVPFRCVKAVSDEAGETLPLDFNRYRDRDGRFQLARIGFAALGRPVGALPGLNRLSRNCRRAAESLGEFLANCQY